MALCWGRAGGRVLRAPKAPSSLHRCPGLCTPIGIILFPPPLHTHTHTHTYKHTLPPPVSLFSFVLFLGSVLFFFLPFPFPSRFFTSVAALPLGGGGRAEGAPQPGAGGPGAAVGPLRTAPCPSRAGGRPRPQPPLTPRTHGDAAGPGGGGVGGGLCVAARFAAGLPSASSCGPGGAARFGAGFCRDLAVGFAARRRPGAAGGRAWRCGGRHGGAARVVLHD